MNTGQRYKMGIMQGRLLPKYKDSYQVFPSTTWENEFEIVSKCGFTEIELLFDIDSYAENPLMNSAGRERIVRLSSAWMINPSSICADFFKKYGFYDRYPRAKDSSVVVLERLIEACGEICCKKILIPFLEETEIMSDSDEDNICRVVGATHKKLDEYGVSLCFETSLTWEKSISLMKKINHPQIKIYFDTGNCVQYGFDPAADLINLSKWIGGIHIKDKNGRGENVILGSGLVDFNAFFQSLEKTDYADSLVMETTMGEDPVATARMHLKYIKSFF